MAAEKGLKRAVVLLSGGLDSSTCLLIARKDGFQPIALSFFYNQRHAVEIEMASRLAISNEAEHFILNLPLDVIGGSALTDDIDVPESEPLDGEIPLTYVPARNLIFLSLALAFAETRNAERIYIGINSLDFSNYPDCRMDFLSKFSEISVLATRAGREGKKIEIKAPLQNMKKSEIVKLADELGLDFSLTSSCYNPDRQGLACGVCASCRLRIKGFKEAGILDKISYEKQ